MAWRSYSFRAIRWRSGMKSVAWAEYFPNWNRLCWQNVRSKPLSQYLDPVQVVANAMNQIVKVKIRHISISGEYEMNEKSLINFNLIIAFIYAEIWRS